MKALSDAAIATALTSEPLWSFTGGKLTRDWKFQNFAEAMDFVNRVAELAEASDHHPDIDIRYNRVRLGLVTHDANGVTNRDLKMARELSRQFPS